MLRHYQEKAIATIYNDLKNSSNVLLSGMMGCGKTIMAVKLIEKILFKKDTIKILILMHKLELINQFDKAFDNFTNIPKSKIGNCCAGLKQKKIKTQIIIASVQTFINILDNYKYADLVIIDECHHINMIKNNQYYEIITYLKKCNPNVRFFGITATPFRTDYGYIYGLECGKGNKNLFPKLNYQISYNDLLKEKYLVPLKGKIVIDESFKEDIAIVGRTNNDYKLNDLSEMMTKAWHLATAVEAITKYATNYKCICVFCCTIKHAEKLHDLLKEESVLIHSKLSSIERYTNMSQWITGKTRIALSVNILTEGFDLPQLDCIIFARPTLSSTLFLQAIGRVLRIHPNKSHGFIIDLTDNTKRFGTDLDNIKISIPKKKKIEQNCYANTDTIKLCPQCDIICDLKLQQCFNCGFEFSPAECCVYTKLPNLTSVNFNKNNKTKRTVPYWSKVKDWWLEDYQSKKNKKIGRIVYKYGENGYKKVSLWLCFKDFYQGYAIYQSQKKWKMVSQEKFPANIKDFLNSKFEQPYKIFVDNSDKFPKIKEIENIPF